MRYSSYHAYYAWTDWSDFYIALLPKSKWNRLVSKTKSMLAIRLSSRAVSIPASAPTGHLSDSAELYSTSREGAML